MAADGRMTLFQRQCLRCQHQAYRVRIQEIDRRGYKDWLLRGEGGTGPEHGAEHRAPVRSSFTLLFKGRKKERDTWWKVREDHRDNGKK